MKTKKCDFCGKLFTGPNYPVYDENWNIQKGINRCSTCFGEELTKDEVSFEVNKK